jgi:hypothetical protein
MQRNIVDTDIYIKPDISQWCDFIW